MYYFAYGSNLSHKQMSERCPGSKFIKKVFLKGYKFVYDGCSKKWKQAVANIIESPDDGVWGGLFEITEKHLKTLDKYEGYPHSYQRKETNVEDKSGNVYSAIIYYRTGKEPGEPNPKYRQIVTIGAKDCGINDNYIHNVIEGCMLKIK